MVVRDTQRKEDLETYTETGRRGAGVKTAREQQAHKTSSGPAPPASCICSLFGISLYSPATSTCTQFPTVAMLFTPQLGGLPLVPSLPGVLPAPLPFLDLAKETQKTECFFQMLIIFLPNPPSAPDHLV